MKKLTPEKLIVMLEKQGKIISHEQAIKVLDFLEMLADMVVENHLHGKENLKLQDNKDFYAPKHRRQKSRNR